VNEAYGSHLQIRIPFFFSERRASTGQTSWWELNDANQDLVPRENTKTDL
jgi:hypothetical protein